MQIMDDVNDENDEQDGDFEDDERVEMDSSGSHCLKLESFIARRRARANAGSANSITVIDSQSNNASILDKRRQSKSPSALGKIGGRSGSFDNVRGS